MMARGGVVGCLCGIASTTLAASPAPNVLAASAEPRIQIAILLDTSSSMDGLINQTREQLWKIVNTFATAKRDGRRAKLELALYQYGNDSLSPANHYVRKMSDLTSNLDKVSETLFALRTNGGEEYCGAVIAHALQELEWSQSPSDLKLIYIAGNEPFDQGPVHFREVVKKAIARGMVVNTIHAGDEGAGVSGHWQEAAKLADGAFLTIDQNRAVVRIDAPQDAELARLNQALNQTYLGYGAQGRAAAQRQVAQDDNAKGMSASSMATRTVAKASAQYRNEEWDLVDAARAGKKVAEMPAEALPAPMKTMTASERAAFVDQKSKERADIQNQINELAKQREAYVQSEMKKRSQEGDRAVDEVLVESAKTAAKASNYSF